MHLRLKIVGAMVLFLYGWYVKCLRLDRCFSKSVILYDLTQKNLRFPVEQKQLPGLERIRQLVKFLLEGTSVFLLVL